MSKPKPEPLSAALDAATGVGLRVRLGDDRAPTRVHCPTCAASLAGAARPAGPARAARRVDTFIARHFRELV